MSLETIRESAAANGLKVGSGLRLVTYTQLADGSWSGCWYAQERSLRAARERLQGFSAANIVAEIWKNGAPLCPSPPGLGQQRASRGSERNDMTVTKQDALLRRYWAVSVLDAWKRAGRQRWVTQWDTYVSGIELGDGDEMGTVYPKYEAATPDSARLAAAKAVFHELPTDVRAELGECP